MSFIKKEANGIQSCISKTPVFTQRRRRRI